METSDNTQLCKACNISGTGNYCNHCGQPYETKRISVSGLIHDVFHLFTHLDKGFGYTVKQLFVSPGKMQRSFIEGNRSRYQKPFSMFFICATVAALTRYWIYLTVEKYYHVGNESEAKFFHEYMVLFQIALLPLNVLLTYLFFCKSKYNYAEIGVLILYTISFFFLNATWVGLLKLIWPHLDTAYIEFPILIFYNTITFINFFNTSPRWSVALKSLVVLITIFLSVQWLEDYMVKVLS